MNNMYDVQQLLKKIGIFIYTGNRMSDLHLMELELQELYKAQLLSANQFANTKRVIQTEIRNSQGEGQK